GGGGSVIYMWQRLEEIIAIADRCTVMRDGRVVEVSRRGAFDVPHLIAAMTGSDAAPERIGSAPPGDILLEETDRRLDAVRVSSGQVVGLAGLLGSGTGRMIRRVFGAGCAPAVVRVNGRSCRPADPVAAIAAGIGMVPGERRLGLVMNQSVRDNILLPSIALLRGGRRLDRAAGDRLVAQLMDALDIRPRRPWLKVADLSGGNQQKVIFAKWLARETGVLLLEDATQGVDVAAKAQIHRLVREFAGPGGGVVATASHLPRP